MLLKNRYKSQLHKAVLLGSLAGVLLGSSALADAGETLRVRHDHDPWGSCEGDLTISASGIDYLPEDKEDHIRHWTWTDIQTVDRRSSDRFSILSYKDQKWLLGRDRPWDFTVLDPQSKGLSDQLFGLIRDNSPRPLVDRISRQIETEYEVPVKHLHTFGGCEGVLRFDKEWIVYETDREKDARSWRRNKEVVNVWSSGKYDLELEVYEKEREDLLRTRRFRFQLKRPLDADYYDHLRRAMLPPR